MIRLVGFLIGLFLLSNIFAVEGMWIPMFLDKYNIEDMQKLGLKLSAEDIYSVNNTSLKDAIVIFGRGCTGSVISSEGLVITNHHCAYGLIQGHSSLERDIVTNGFWAESEKDEISNPGLQVTFLVRIEDVTDKIMDGVNDNMTEAQRAQKISENSRSISNEAVKDTHYKAEVKPFFQGNQYFLIVNEVFTDVRLVGAPPSSIGKFGGDTDNWMWPRHTGDFALFRVYTDPEGKPAAFSEENIPLSPKKFLPVSTKGVEKGDFTFVFGYPGTTVEYLPSFAVEQILYHTYPNRILIRDKKLEVIKSAMDSDHAIRLQYTAKAASISNAWKKWKGEIRGLNRLNAVVVKQEYEQRFMKWVNSDPNLKAKYGNILSEYEELHKTHSPYEQAYYFLNEAGFGAEIIILASRMRILERATKDNKENIPLIQNEALTTAKTHFKNYDAQTDEKIFAEMIKLYYENVPERFHPESFLELEKFFRKHENPFEAYAAHYFSKSMLSTEEKAIDFLENLSHRSLKRLHKDPVYNLMQDFVSVYRNEIHPNFDKNNTRLDSLNRVYMKAQMEFEQDRVFYPDANFTMRISYGQVDTYYPADGVKYDYFTTLDGKMEKENPDIYDYKINNRLKELWLAGDFGPYSDSDGKMRTCFIASNHTTGGNSGSPILNANGELVGVNFDRNWEGTMSDIMYDPDRCRNISIDIRYALFIIDKFAGAGHLLEEMDLRK